MKLLLPVIFLSASTFGLICQKPGKCVNSRWIIPNKKVETPHECLVSCQDTNHCTWASYWPATNGRWCYHYRDCTTLAATDYPQCITGHVKCATCGIVGQCKVIPKWLWFWLFLILMSGSFFRALSSKTCMLWLSMNAWTIASKTISVNFFHISQHSKTASFSAFALKLMKKKRNSGLAIRSVTYKLPVSLKAIWSIDS